MINNKIFVETFDNNNNGSIISIDLSLTFQLWVLTKYNKMIQQRLFDINIFRIILDYLKLI